MPLARATGPRRHPRITTTAVAAALMSLAACGSQAASEPTEPATPPPTTAPVDDAAGGTRLAAISPSEALTFDPPMPLVVEATLHVSGDGTWRLCEALRESFPPQCAEEKALVVTNPEAIAEADRAGLREAEGIRWGEEMVVYAGERRDGGGFHVIGSPDAEGLVGGDAVGGNAPPATPPHATD